MSELRRAVFEDFASGLDRWVGAVCDAVADPDGGLPWVDDVAATRRLADALPAAAVEDLRVVVGEGMRGLLHTVLAVIDGAASSAETGRVRLVSEDGQPLGEGLHELFFDYLLETGRMARPAGRSGA